MLRVSLLLILLLATAPSQAGVVSRDLFEPGDGLLTYDDVNQREWLDFSVTHDLFNPSSPTAITLPERLSSFQLATLDQVEALMFSAMVPKVDAWSVPGEPSGSADLIELMGLTGQFTGSVLGDMQFAGGYVAIDATTTNQSDATVALLAFNFGVETIPGALNRPANDRSTNGYYRLTMDEYPFALGPIDLEIDGGFIPTIGDQSPVEGDRQADDLNGNGNPGFIEVVGPNGEVIKTIADYGDIYTFNVFYDRIQGTPTYWLYRDASPIPEPTTTCLMLTACLVALRLRGLA